MSLIYFTKYHGTANDFVIIDERSTDEFDVENVELIRQMCDRRTGIGADGLMLIKTHEREDIDFEMLYFNADGRPSSMCGNGGRCITLAASRCSLFFERARFLFDGDVYMATFDSARNWVSLKMQDVLEIHKNEEDYVLDTGSPHYVKFVEEIPVNVKEAGSEIRYSPAFQEEGINVNFVMWKDEKLHVLTYERGVEDETFSCGTGVTAAAICWAEKINLEEGIHLIPILTKGGELELSYEKTASGYRNIFLKGPAVKVYEGAYDVLLG